MPTPPSPRRSWRPPAPPTAGSSTAEPRSPRAAGSKPARPVFYYDLGSPEAYLAAERVNGVLPVVPLWQPVLARDLPSAAEPPVAAAVRPATAAELERRAAAQGLQPFRWPSRWPPDTAAAMLAATFAQRSGRVVAFSLAAFRQAFAAGRDLSEIETVLIAAAACELHPRAVLKGVESRSIREGLAAAASEAAERGVTGVPAIRVGARVFVGEERLEHAAQALGAGDSLE